MPFIPGANDPLTLVEEKAYRFAEHPAAPGLPYGQEGRTAVVYKLVIDDGGAQALKVFKAAYRVSSIVGHSATLAPLAVLPALQVCRRTILDPSRHQLLLDRYPELLYATLMPWIEGPTWMEVLVLHRVISREQSLGLAVGLLRALTVMEESGIAHCDLAGPNIVLPGLLEAPAGRGALHVELIDVEQMYGPTLGRPQRLVAGSSGYTHRAFTEDTAWSSYGDRFAGAMLLAEFLGWSDATVRQSAWGESYFNPDELQQNCPRYQGLRDSLSQHWGPPVAGLLEQAWSSESLADCPAFWEWSTVLDNRPTEKSIHLVHVDAVASNLQEVAADLERQQNYSGALTVQQHLRQWAGKQGDGLTHIEAEIARLETAVSVADAAGGSETILPVQTSPLDELFADGLAAVQQNRWRDARELLGEVMRQDPDYAHDGWEGRKLLREVKRRSRPFGVKALLLGGRLLALVALVALLFAGALALAYLNLVRPSVSSAVFSFAGAQLPDPAQVAPEGCWVFTERQINDSLSEGMPLLAHTLEVDLRDGCVLGFVRPYSPYGFWAWMCPPSGTHGDDFALERVSVGTALRVLVTPSELADFVNSYVADGILGPRGAETLSVELSDETAVICIGR